MLFETTKIETQNELIVFGKRGETKRLWPCWLVVKMSRGLMLGLGSLRMCVRQIENFKLAVGVNACLSYYVACPGYNPAFVQSQWGLTPQTAVWDTGHI